MLKFRKIASVVASAAMLSSTVALAAAANFPAPFVSSGQADVAVVWGSTGAASDSVAATSIVSEINKVLPAETAKSTPKTTTNSTSITSGDYVKLEKSSNKFNLGDTMSGVFGATVDSGDLETVLADGTYMNDENTEYEYDQKLTLQALQLTQFADSDYEDKEPTVAFRVTSGSAILNYTLDFTTDAESDVTSGDLVDFETTTIEMLGKEFYVLDAINGTDAGYFGKFTLLDAANTAIVTEGEASAVTVGDKSYDVAITFVDSTSTILEVNGQKTNSLSEGSTYKLKDGTYIGVKDILYNSKDAGISKVEISIGNGKLEIPSDGSEIELNDETVDGVKAWMVRGTASSGKQRLDKVVIEWTADDEYFIAPGTELQMPGFGAVKFVMTDFVVPGDEKTVVDYDGDTSIKLNVPLISGDAEFNILYANATGDIIGIGKDSDELLATSGASTLTFYEKKANNDYHDYFIATYNTSDEAESYLLRAKMTRGTGGEKNKTTITDVVTGKDICTDEIESGTCEVGDLSLTLTTIGANSTDEWVVLTAGTNVNFNTVFTEEGLKIYLPYSYDSAEGDSTAMGAFNNLTSIAPGHSPASFYLFFTEEDKDDNKGDGKTFNVTVNDDSDGELSITDIDSGYSELEVPGSSDDTTTMVQSDLATKITRLVSSDKGRAEVEYAGEQSYADVYVAESSATSSSTDGTTEKGVVLISDTEVDSVSGKNLIVVGGSCVNTVARSLLGGTAAICGTEFTAKTGVEAGQFLIQTFDRGNGKVATLVAGYNAGDTTNAATYLTTQTVDTTVGKKYVGTTASQANLVTTTA